MWPPWYTHFQNEKASSAKYIGPPLVHGSGEVGAFLRHLLPTATGHGGFALVSVMEGANLAEAKLTP